jgi:hypothetical protein
MLGCIKHTSASLSLSELKSGSFPTAFKGHDLKVETTVE